MRRPAPAPSLRVDRAAAPRWGRVEQGPRGIGIVEAPAPDGVVLADDGPAWRPLHAAPAPAHEAAVVADGALVLVDRKSVV